MKGRIKDLLQLLLRFLIVVWIWTFGLLFLGLFCLCYKTKEFIQIRVLKREP